MAEIFSGLALMPRLETMKLSGIPLGTLKTHFSRLSLMSFARSFMKVYSRLAMTYSAHFDLNTMSST